MRHRFPITLTTALIIWPSIIIAIVFNLAAGAAVALAILGGVAWRVLH